MSADVAYHSLITPKLNQRGWAKETSLVGRARRWKDCALDWADERKAFLLGFAAGLVLICVGLWTYEFDLVSRVRSSAPSVDGLEYRALFHEVPDFPRQDSDLHTLEATDRHLVTVVELHGLGAHWTENPFRGTLAEACPYIKWVSPQARVSNVTVRNNEPTSAWFNIATFADLYEDEDEGGMIESQREIHALIEHERQVLRDLGREPRIVLAGFSQGAVMSLLATLTAEEPVEAALLLSGYLALTSRKNELGPVAHKETKIWWGHGAEDPYLTPQLAQQSVDLLRSPLFSLNQVEFKIFPGLSHYWAWEELTELREWVVKNVPAEPSIV